MLHVNRSVKQELLSSFSVCLTIYTSAGLSHTERDSVGVKSVEMGLTASLPLLHRVDRLLLQQHQWWKIDDMVLLLLKLTLEATKSNCHIMFYIDGKHLPTAQSLARWMIECQLSMCRHSCVLCSLFIFQSLFFFDRPVTPVILWDQVVGTVSGSSWICCCHSCHVCASNCLSTDSAQWGPSAKPGFRSVYPHWDSVSWDGTATQCP